MNELLKRLRAAVNQVLLLLLRPREFVSGPEGLKRGQPSTLELFGWMVGFASVLLGVYSLSLGSPMERVMRASHLLAAPSSRASTNVPQQKPVTFGGLRWMAGLGFGITFPQRLPFAEPQRADFQFGAVNVRLNNVIPQNVVEKNTAKFLIALYALVFVLCLHPVARLFGGKGDLRDAFRLGFTYCGFLYLVMAVLLVSATLVLVDLLRLEGHALQAVWAIVVGLPGGVILARSFVIGYSAFYQITMVRLLLVCLGTWLSSSIVCPAVFLPLIFGILRFEPLWKAIL